MNFNDQSFYLISNSSTDLYPDNSLSSFTNNLPFDFQIDANKQAEVAISFLGLSTNFRNVIVPPKDLPSIFVSNCFKQETGKCPDDLNCQIPIEFSFQDNAKSVEEKVKCEWGGFVFENKTYSKIELQKFFDGITDSCIQHGIPLIFSFTDDMRLVIKSEAKIPNWVLLHKSVIDTFNFKNKINMVEHVFEGNTENRVYSVRTANEIDVFLRKTYIAGEEYYTYKIQKKDHPDAIDDFIESAPSYVLHKTYPNIIKVICENISPQILNTSFSKDLVVFSPDYSNKEEYLTIEFSNKQYVPISNSILSNFSIKLVDGNNKPLQLSLGPSTIIKMDIRQKNLEKQSFNVRLTSAKSDDFPDNNNAIFKVKLPTQIDVNRNWRVALTSISNPNIFSTFIADEDTRSLFVRELNGEKKTMKVKIPDNRKIYTAEELISFIDLNLKLSKIGSVSIVDDNCLFKFNTEVVILASNYLLKILGYHGNINSRRKLTKMTINTGNEISHLTDQSHQIVKSIDNSFELEFKGGIDLKYLKPTYIMVYSNIVSRSIIGGTMSNILKVVPIRSRTDDYYVISDFKHKEFYELQNSIVETIEVNLRSHDGVPINFASNQDTILNLEFSNYPDN